MKRIVLVEDDEKLAQLTSQYLVKNGFEVVVEYDGANALAVISEQQPDIVILDLMLPNVDGFSLCRTLRADFHGGILFLTASQDDIDHVAGLELGADDFITKPVHPRVLLARIRLLLRKLDAQVIQQPENTEKNILQFGALQINAVHRQVNFDQAPLAITSAEFDLLWLLASHAEQILSRDQLLKALRGVEYDGADRSVDVKIASLRKKLSEYPNQVCRIITVRNKGYLFAPE
ncbi:response regulator [Candidatus Albibeggiatoa sp. nov. NOAA]|uniref:response regulator n=1 Tax=Candidatus Albibeggiatoa sp. nov. NOAA TaxID=3162724 RepID=UPI003303ADC6|nr:response regulator [Thiotrichaceae bacterium]